MKQFKKQQDDIAHIKKFVASCGTYSNLVIPLFNTPQIQNLILIGFFNIGQTRKIET